MSDTVAVALIAVGGSAFGAVVGGLASYLAASRAQRTEIERLRVGHELERKHKGEDFKHGKRMAYKEFVIKAERTSVDPRNFGGSKEAVELGVLYNAFLFSAPRPVIDLAEAYRATVGAPRGPTGGRGPRTACAIKDGDARGC